MNDIVLGNSSLMNIEYNVYPNEYSKENELNIIKAASEKYCIPEANISVTVKFKKREQINSDKFGSDDIVSDIQDPKFQLNLFEKYIKENSIEKYDFDLIKSIDSQVNSQIDFSLYGNRKKYEILSIKIDNFLSFGEGVYYDFRKLNGLVLLTGQPANQCGKSSFAFDAIHVGLFGKTTSGKIQTNADVFNKYLEEETECKIEIELLIDGETYIISRTFTRPPLSSKSKNRPVTQTVKYYRKINDSNNEELADIDNLSENSVQSTNKAIKDAIGDEKDFDLVICANSDTLKDLINLKPTSRGKLFTKFSGLSSIEDKETVAKEIYKRINKNLYSNIYNRVTLNQEIASLKEENDKVIDNINSRNNRITELDKEIEKLDKERETLLLSKKPIDESLTGIDVKTLEIKLNEVISDGKLKSEKKNELISKSNSIGDVYFDKNEYNSLLEERNKTYGEVCSLQAEYKNKLAIIETLKKSEYCPTCGKKFDNVDNSKEIQRVEDEQAVIITSGKEKRAYLEQLDEKIKTMSDNMSLYNEKNKIEVEISALNVDLERMRAKYKETKDKIFQIEKNKEIIEENNKINSLLTINKDSLNTSNNYKSQLQREITMLTSDKKSNDRNISEKTVLVKKIDNEENLILNWKLYLDMVGKNGIVKMVLKETLPIINCEMKRILDGVCDFEVETTIDDKNDVQLYLVRGDTRQNLSSGSGYEQTTAALALRVVLGNISTLSSPSFMLFDEILGGVSKDNYENIKKLFDRVAKQFSFILHITHITETSDWHNHTINIVKENNISRIIE